MRSLLQNQARGTSLQFRKFDYEGDEDSRLLAQWENDPEIRHFCTYSPDEEAARQPVTFENVRKRTLEKKDRVYRYVILFEGRAVGEMSLDLHSPQVLYPNPRTAWLGIVIGEKECRGRGLGAQAMAFIEGEASRLGAGYMELGVFEYNDRAIRLYKKLGYEEFKRIPEFNFWNGRLWSDLRMIKRLN